MNVNTRVEELPQRSACCLAIDDPGELVKYLCIYHLGAPSYRLRAHRRRSDHYAIIRSLLLRMPVDMQTTSFHRSEHVCVNGFSGGQDA